jgi:hypothetical protein
MKGRLTRQEVYEGGKGRRKRESRQERKGMICRRKGKKKGGK